ncbi:GTP cyclohydrolase II [Pseudoruegeria sp. SK021]|uniref:GTP cyclohydrolase II n=1 Tax=Pseudoruegeria sp. SK021 TaxID=1933035 RepID=UPI000A21C78F|nr:GTP cyclohydrolase II [Pseudoruegeria sp. SK021]OSP55059.1 GTP cyclohydrolase II [Pseudoruegeria sp. SK021]
MLTLSSPLGPAPTERLARARADLRMGLGVVVTSEPGNPASGALILAAETLSADRLAAARQLGPAVLAVTARRAATLNARIYDGDLARVALPDDADLAWVQALADPADDLRSPMKGPFLTLRDGPSDLHRAGIALCKSARILPATLVVPLNDAANLATAQNLTRVSADEILTAAATFSPLHSVVSARVPLAVSTAGKLHVFRPEDGGEEHYAVEIGTPDRDAPVLARLHSACFTGDLLGSLKCDCGPQLRAALAQMGAEGSGVLLYLNQEGRGIGLANKMRAYSLQDQGFDTVEANHRLGFEDDERDFRLGAALLTRLGFSKARLMTNNPAKVTMLTRCGIDVVDRVPLKVGRGPLNAAYLDTKAIKSGHFL